MLMITPIVSTRDEAIAHLIKNLALDIEGQDSLRARLMQRIRSEPVSVFAITHGQLAEESIPSYVASKQWTQPAQGDDEVQIDIDLELLLQAWLLFNPKDTVIIHPTLVELRRPYGEFESSLYFTSGTNVYCIVDSTFTSQRLDEAISDCDQSACDKLCISFLRASRDEVQHLDVETLSRRVQFVATHAFDKEGFVLVRFDGQKREA